MPAHLAARALDDSPIKQVFSDALLVQRPRTYGRFLRQLQKRGMLDFSVGNSTSRLGIFFVIKKDESLRMICDTRLLNLMFKEPCHTSLPTGGGWSRIESDSDSYYIAHADIFNAFHCMRVPDSLSHMFTFPTISARHLDINSLNGTPLSLPTPLSLHA